MIDVVGTPELTEYLQTQPAMAVPYFAVSTSEQVATGRYLYVGGVGRNLTTTAGGIGVYDGQADANKQIAQITIPASGASQSTGPTFGILVENGIWVVATGGTFTGSIWLVPLDFRTIERWHELRHAGMGAARRGA